MSKPASSFDLPAAQQAVQAAVAAGKLTASAAENLNKWLTESRYAEYAPEIAQHIEEADWQTLDDAFWTVIPFGTGGRRGKMYPFGSNTINRRTIGESAQGLAAYVKETQGEQGLKCAIAYDTRHRSREFAELCAGVMVANGFEVYFLDDYRSTPELSFLVRFKNCSCGVMVTASHNPPSDNAVKVYWSTGGQLVPPHDKAVIARVESVDEIPVANFDEAVASGKIHLCTEEIDAAFLRELKGQSFDGPRDLSIIYSPLHGVGESCVRPALEAVGFEQLEVFGPQREPNGDFPNVPGHVSNPENPRVFDAIVERAKETGAELILATDPDCDRMGCCAPVSKDLQGEWKSLNGNQLGALLTDFVLEKRRSQLTPEHYVVKTLVTTEMIRRIADSYNVRTLGNLQVGFKWIGDVMDQAGPDKFLLGTEESHGYLVGQYARDKDGAVACMLMAELAASVKASGKSLHEKLDDLYWQHGYHAEQLLNQVMEGSDGMAKMQALMASFRDNPPATLGGMQVATVRDYKNSVLQHVGGDRETLDGPVGDMVILDFATPGNYIAVRPSGTEPKVKFYMFAYEPAEQLANLDVAKEEMAERLQQLQDDLKAYAASV
ncbi:phospho-sugar mutase [Lignipirellula cremea]|uniref:Phosphoglucomutase n=1 Tax=Lignipirellula cremea TaxID=2528010 RepID=A0A518DQ89_9BACT|nr:phospho-sugar mutase [Lignipirellula cremea]QDU94003.1 Phosphoglucomutase [Lignipirellula cremea]